MLFIVVNILLPGVYLLQMPDGDADLGYDRCTNGAY